MLVAQASHIVEHIPPFPVDGRLSNLVDLLVAKGLLTAEEVYAAIGEHRPGPIFIRFMNEVWRIMRLVAVRDCRPARQERRLPARPDSHPCDESEQVALLRSESSALQILSPASLADSEVLPGPVRQHRNCAAKGAAE